MSEPCPSCEHSLDGHNEARLLRVPGPPKTVSQAIDDGGGR